MKKLKLIFLCLIIIPEILNASSITPEILWSLNRIYEGAISPDNSLLLYRVGTPDINKNLMKTNIFILDIRTNEGRQLTFKGNNYDAVWAPDGKKIFFISDREESPQVYEMELNRKNDIKKITDAATGVANLLLSPDGKYIAYTSDVKLEKTTAEKYPELDRANVYIYDKLPVRHWNVWEDEYYSHVFIMNLKTGDTHDIMEGELYDSPLMPFGGVSQLAWSPESTELAYTSKKVKNYAESTNSSIYVYNLETGKTTDIAPELKGYDMEPLYSPDGKYIAFHSQEHDGYESDRIRFMLYDRANHKNTEITKHFGQWAGEYCWAPDSKSIFFNSADTGKIKLFNIELNGNWKVVRDGFFNYGDRFLGITGDGNTLIYSKRNFNRAAELYALDLKSGEERQLTDINGKVFANIDKALIKERWITSSDGSKVHCWVVYPPGFDSTKKYPMITYCQGGPQQPVSQHFSYGWNFLLFATNGYIVLAPNRRGCPGFGQEWVDAIRKDYYGKPMEDILSATDEMAKEPYVDKNKLSAVGASAGGYATFWLAGNHKHRFKAFVAHCGIFDMTSQYGATEELWFPNWDNGGPYWWAENKDYYERSSPHFYADKWDTPILIITGMKDFRVPYTQSLEAFTVAQSLGIPSKILIYPDEYHWIIHPQEKILWYREFFDFLGKYAK